MGIKKIKKPGQKGGFLKLEKLGCFTVSKVEDRGFIAGHMGNEASGRPQHHYGILHRRN